LAVYLASAGFAYAEYDGNGSETGTIKKVGYSTIKSGSKLKWLPYRPQEVSAEADATRVEQAARWTSSSAANDSQPSAQSALDDPFGDKMSGSTRNSDAEQSESLSFPVAGSRTVSASPALIRVAGSASLARADAGNNIPGVSNNTLSPNSTDQTLEQSLSAKSPDIKDSCPSVKDFKKITQLSTNITPSAGDVPKDCPWGGEDFQPRVWQPITFTWTASGLCHKPLYFEDIQLERYGHALGPWVQPFASGVHFFLTLPILPYKMGLELPNECMYTLGYYRPGDCAPYMLDPIPLSIRAGLFEAGAWIGGAAIIP
jgi:hypothetical protein